eukprot:TRINITY_DN8538_c0_g2_i1.p1 TRINITY_DN8538_c0_g2~~TRINITY_DN8538_c0_g2_i1.p1  ORF type:complete len:1384 (-),score=286.77 TRINITY_DN8538_c0_g2_i1:697-4461(-)
MDIEEREKRGGEGRESGNGRLLRSQGVVEDGGALASLPANWVEKVEDEDESPETLILSGKRKRAAVDYCKLNEELFGAEPASGEKAAPKLEEDSDDGDWGPNKPRLRKVLKGPQPATVVKLDSKDELVPLETGVHVDSGLGAVFIALNEMKYGKHPQSSTKVRVHEADDRRDAADKARRKLGKAMRPEGEKGQDSGAAEGKDVAAEGKDVWQGEARKKRKEGPGEGERTPAPMKRIKDGIIETPGAGQGSIDTQKTGEGGGGRRGIRSRRQKGPDSAVIQKVPGPEGLRSGRDEGLDSPRSRQEDTGVASLERKLSLRGGVASDTKAPSASGPKTEATAVNQAGGSVDNKRPTLFKLGFNAPTRSRTRRSLSAVPGKTEGPSGSATPEPSAQAKAKSSVDCHLESANGIFKAQAESAVETENPAPPSSSGGDSASSLTKMEALDGGGFLAASVLHHLSTLAGDLLPHGNGEQKCEQDKKNRPLQQDDNEHDSMPAGTSSPSSTAEDLSALSLPIHVAAERWSESRHDGRSVDLWGSQDSASLLLNSSIVQPSVHKIETKMEAISVLIPSKEPGELAQGVGCLPCMGIASEVAGAGGEDGVEQQLGETQLSFDHDAHFCNGHSPTKGLSVKVEMGGLLDNGFFSQEVADNTGGADETGGAAGMGGEGPGAADGIGGAGTGCDGTGDVHLTDGTARTRRDGTDGADGRGGSDGKQDGTGGAVGAGRLDGADLGLACLLDASGLESRTLYDASLEMKRSTSVCRDVDGRIVAGGDGQGGVKDEVETEERTTAREEVRASLDRAVLVKRPYVDIESTKPSNASVVSAEVPHESALHEIGEAAPKKIEGNSSRGLLKECERPDLENGYDDGLFVNANKEGTEVSDRALTREEHVCKRSGDVGGKYAEDGQRPMFVRGGVWGSLENLCIIAEKEGGLAGTASFREQHQVEGEKVESDQGASGQGTNSLLSGEHDNLGGLKIAGGGGSVYGATGNGAREEDAGFWSCREGGLEGSRNRGFTEALLETCRDAKDQTSVNDGETANHVPDVAFNAVPPSCQPNDLGGGLGALIACASMVEEQENRNTCTGKKEVEIYENEGRLQSETNGDETEGGRVFKGVGRDRDSRYETSPVLHMQTLRGRRDMETVQHTNVVPGMRVVTDMEVVRHYGVEELESSGATKREEDGKDESGDTEEMFDLLVPALLRMPRGKRTLRTKIGDNSKDSLGDLSVRPSLLTREEELVSAKRIGRRPKWFEQHVLDR